MTVSAPAMVSWNDGISNSSKFFNDKGTHSVVVSLYNTYLYWNTAEQKQ